MPTFPSLTGYISNTGLTDELNLDPTVTGPLQGGPQQAITRAAVFFKKFTRQGRFLTETDKSTLETFQGTVSYGQVAFDWDDDTTDGSTTYEVRFGGPLRFQKEETNPSRWKCTFEFIQVSA